MISHHILRNITVYYDLVIVKKPNVADFIFITAISEGGPGTAAFFAIPFNSQIVSARAI